MIIRLKENINSECGTYEASKGEEMSVIKCDDKLAIYHCRKAFAPDHGEVYEVCKESAEVVQGVNSLVVGADAGIVFSGESEQEKPAGEKLEHLIYNNETNKLEYPLPNLDMKFAKEWKPVTCTEPKIERDGQKIKLLRAVWSNCGQCKTSDNLVLDIIHTDNEKQIYFCKSSFSEAVTYDVPFSYGELIQDEAPVEQEVNSLSMGADISILSAGEAEQEKPPSDYHLPNVFSQVKYFDYYMFARAQQAAGLVIDPELAHVQKKLFVPYRGHKSTKQDVIECIKTLKLWLENNENS